MNNGDDGGVVIALDNYEPTNTVPVVENRAKHLLDADLYIEIDVRPISDLIKGTDAGCLCCKFSGRYASPEHFLD